MTRSAGAGGLRLDHIGIAVRDLEKAREEYSRLLGMRPSPIEEVPSEKVRLVFFELGNARIELLEPTSPDSPIHRFLERGRGGVHHISLCIDSGDLGEHCEKLRALGLPVLGDGVREGSGGSRVFFLHPGAASGVLFEFSQGPGADASKETGSGPGPDAP